MFVEGVTGYCFTIFVSVSGWECLSLDVVSLSLLIFVVSFCLLVVCIYIYNSFSFYVIVFLYFFCTNRLSVLLILYRAVSSLIGV